MHIGWHFLVLTGMALHDIIWTRYKVILERR